VRQTVNNADRTLARPTVARSVALALKTLLKYGIIQQVRSNTVMSTSTTEYSLLWPFSKVVRKKYKYAREIEPMQLKFEKVSYHPL